MADRRVCARCGTAMKEYAGGRLCPSCLLRGGLTETDQRAEVGGQNSDLNSPATHHSSLPHSFGDYELLEVIARGGMGVVYRARQKSLNRTVAVKMLLAGEFAQPKFIERFRAEAEAVAQLQHPNIVAIHEVGEHDGHQFFSMDYVEGTNLAEVISDFGFRISDFQRCASWLKTIAEAVHYAHQRGIIHRDLKPSNVLIDALDQPRITDFGLAKRLNTEHRLLVTDHSKGAGRSDQSSVISDQLPDLTLTGQVLGSPNYLPPEQAEGRHGQVGPPSDVYSLGAILYHLLTGRPPFQAESLTTVLKQVLETEPVAPRLLNPGVPRDLETICLKCLEKNVPRRYQTAQELAEELGRFLNGQPVLARPVGPTGKVWRWCHRQPVRAGLIGALIVVFAAGAAGVLWQWRQAQHNLAAEAVQRRAAVAAGVEAELREYAANIALAQGLIQTHQFGRARDTLLARTPESYRGWEWGWLLRGCNQDLMTLSDNPSLNQWASFSPDSRYLVTAGRHPVIWIWDLATGKTVRSLSGHTGWLGITPFSPDGRHLCSLGWSGGDTTVRVWDMETFQPVFQPRVHPDGVYNAAFSPDGRRLVTACADGKVRVYDAATGADTGLTNDYGDQVHCAEFSPDGRRIAYAGGSFHSTKSQDTTVRIWDLATGKTERLVGHAQEVACVAWSPDGSILVSSGWDGKIKVWDTSSWEELPPFEASPKQRFIFSVAFSPDGRLLGAAGLDDPNPTARATLFDVRTRRVVRELAGHSLIVRGIRFSPDGQYVATSAWDDTVKVWSVEPPPTCVSLEGHDQTVWTAAFSPDGNRVATGSLDQMARIWDATTGALLRTYVVRFPVVSLGFSHDGQRLATVGPENTACVWKLDVSGDPSDGPLGLGLRRSSAALVSEPSDTSEGIEKAPEDWRTPRRLRGHTRAVLAVAWSTNDQWIATASKDQTAKIWNVSTGTERLTLAGHEGSVQAVAFAPDGNILATGSADSTVRLWSVSSGQCLRALTNHAAGVLSLAFSPNGNLLATGSADGSARLWDTHTGRQVHVLAGHMNGVTAVAFGPDGQRLVTTAGGTDLYATATREGRVFFWDVASGRQLFALPTHDNAVYAAAFSPDGQRLVTASGDNTARIWTAFPWRSTDYPGDSKIAFFTRVEEFKRHFWRSAISTQREADARGRPWTNGFHLYHHSYGDLNLPPPGSKTQPLLPIPPRPALASANQIDLTGLYNVALNESWQPIGDLADVDRNLEALPGGVRTFAGVPFDVRGFVQLRGVAPDSELYPDRVVIPVKRAFQRLHALHGTTWFERQGRPIGAFVLHYANGEVAELPIVFGEHLWGEDPRGGAGSDCPNGRLAWGAGSSADPADNRPRLYQTTFANPKPTLEVVRIEYVSQLTRCGPLLVALTVE